MAINVIEVADEDVKRILKVEEGHFVDVKAIGIAPAKLTRTLSAFANADGGELYIGVGEDKRANIKSWNGFSTVEAANGHLQICDELFPFGGELVYEFFKNDSHNGLVLHIIVQKSRQIKRASDSKAYLRRGAQCLPCVTPEAIERLKRSKGITSFESETLPVPLSFVDNSEVIIGFMLTVIPIGEPRPWLLKQMLIVDDKPTVGAVLLYADEPQVALPKRSAIKIYRYTTTDREGSREHLAFDPITVEGCLYDQIKKSVAMTVRIIEEAKILGPDGMEPVSYPIETLHEIITNAVLHRDYEQADDVHVRIFDNRIEVESPGRLPAHITEQNILQERFARNGAIVRLINKFPNPPNKDVGEGLNTAFAAMKKLKLREPIVNQTENAVIVNIRHQKLGTPEEIILNYLKEYREITNRKVRELTGIGSENKVKSIFLRLADRGQIERVPNKNGSAAAWQLCGN